jgi:hypothetical protein
VSLASLTKHLRIRERKEERQSKQQELKWTQKSLSHKPLSVWSEFGTRRGFELFVLCLGVNARALVLNVIFRKLGCLMLWWLGVFIAPNHQGSRWGGCWRWAHRTGIVRYPMRRHVTQPLGFWSSWPLAPLSSCGTGQSGGAPDSTVPLWLAALTSTTVLCCNVLLSELTIARWRAVARWLTGQFVVTPDSPVNYSRVRLRFPESGYMAPIRPWCTRHCPVAHRTVWCARPQHTQVFCSGSI